MYWQRTGASPLVHLGWRASEQWNITKVSLQQQVWWADEKEIQLLKLEAL